MVSEIPLANFPNKTWRQRLAIISQEFLKTRRNYYKLRYIGVANEGKEIVHTGREKSFGHRKVINQGVSTVGRGQ